MVKTVSYGTLSPSPEAVPTEMRRKVASVYAGLLGLALVAVAVVFYVQSSGNAELVQSQLFEYDHVGAHSADYSATTDPADLTDDQVKNVWFDKDHAWDGIDDILPTASNNAWDDENDPTVGYAFKNRGSTTSPDGFTGYYDTSLRDGTDVFPNTDSGTGVNDILGYDPILNGGNALWGRHGGDTVMTPVAWNHVKPMSVEDISDSDWVPYGFTQKFIFKDVLRKKAWAS